MNWTRLLEDKRVAKEPTSKNELDELRKMAAINLRDARVAGISAQGRYEFAYNAARLFATIVVRACGYRVIAKNGYHYFTFQALQAADVTFEKAAVYFDAARDIRNDFSYDSPVSISDTDADDLTQSVEHFEQQAAAWVKALDATLA